MARVGQRPTHKNGFRDPTNPPPNKALGGGGDIYIYMYVCMCVLCVRACKQGVVDLCGLRRAYISNAYVHAHAHANSHTERERERERETDRERERERERERDRDRQR